MHGNLPIAGDGAIFPAVTSVVEKSIADTSVGDDENWFSDAVLRLLGKEKPGTALDCITDLRFGERNCQRYAGGDVKPPGYFVRALLRSKDGEPFLRALMDGCDQSWWLEWIERKDCADAYEAKRRK